MVRHKQVPIFVQLKAIPVEQLPVTSPSSDAFTERINQVLVSTALPCQQALVHAHTIRKLLLELAGGIDIGADAARDRAIQKEKTRQQVAAAVADEAPTTEPLAPVYASPPAKVNKAKGTLPRQKCMHDLIALC
jgi:hypothetical protein